MVSEGQGAGGWGTGSCPELKACKGAVSHPSLLSAPHLNVEAGPGLILHCSALLWPGIFLPAQMIGMWALGRELWSRYS